MKRTSLYAETLFTMTMVSVLLLAASPRGALAQGAPQPFRTFEKTNRVVLDVGAPGAFDSTHAKYPCVLKVGDEWWMSYNGRTDDRFTGCIGLATSKDGLLWTKQNDGHPVFEHGPQGTFDSTKVDHPSVLRFDGKYHLWYTAGDNNSCYTIGYATSPNGVHWTRQNNARPVLGPGRPGRFDEGMVLHPAVVRDPSGLLHMWYNGVGPQKSFRVGHATSRDGIQWTRQNHGQPVLNPGAVGDFQEEYVYNVFVMLEDGQFHMWYSAWAANEHNTGGKHSGLTHAVSLDGDHWVKDPVPTLMNGPPGSLDEYACFACNVVQRGPELWMYYSAGSGDTGGLYRVSLAKCRLSE